MNGIIHNCARRSDGSAFPQTESETMLKIFLYLDKIVGLIKPKRLLYLALDGCAPRAKMNQQRQRRFRSKKEQEEALKLAKTQGKPVPDEPFDSNCITPGTEFMQKLTEHLKFYIRKKLKEDIHWRDMKVIFSGHEVPGEGEHKILEYIRHSKTQPEWDPNQRHCLYGLDADLIMLSLVTHEPHFCLLREVITQRGKPVEDEYLLLHVCLLREYLDLEFRNDTMSFPFDLERVINDFIMMCFFIGNDFLPSLPGLDIAEGSLNYMFEIYKDNLPVYGYLTNSGEMNPTACKEFFKKLSIIERQNLESVYEYQDLQIEVLHSDDKPADDFASFGKSIKEEDGVNTVADGLKNASLDDSKEAESDGEESDTEDEPVVGESTKWKEHYYMSKFKKSFHDKEFLAKATYSYLEGLQWVMHYYCHGCVSWPWFYPYYHTPLADDLKEAAFPDKFNFELGQPFWPFEQLMGVLPPASAELLPEPYRWLMRDPSSPILDFYPLEWEIDTTGKKNSWEHTILLPFIDEKRLLAAMSTVDQSKLTAPEKQRNSRGKIYLYTYDVSNSESYPSSLPQLFNEIQQCASNCKEYTLPHVTYAELVNSFHLSVNSKYGLQGHSLFPTVQSVPHSCTLQVVGVKLFGHPSKRETMVVKIENDKEEYQNLEDVSGLLGKQVFVEWPYHREATVVGVSCAKGKVTSVVTTLYDETDRLTWDKEIKLQDDAFLHKKGIALGEIRFLLHIRPIEGMTQSNDGSIHKKYSVVEQAYPLQVAVFDVPNSYKDRRFLESGPVSLQNQFPLNSKALHVGKPNYGAIATVVGYNNDTIQVSIDPVPTEPTFGQRIAVQMQERYYSLDVVCRNLNISPRVLSKITGSLYLDPHGNTGLNIKFTGKNQQVQGYARRVSKAARYDPSYIKETWEFSEKAINVLKEYQTRFPEFFDALEEYSQADNLRATDVFPEKPEQRVKEIQSWLQGLEINQAPLVPCGSQYLSAEAIAAVEREAEKFRSLYDDARKSIVKDVTVSQLLKTNTDSIAISETTDLLRKQEFELGDRVMSLRNTGTPPFGLRGTVVEVVGSQITVVFDHEFFGGTSLGNRCSNLKGLGNLKETDLLNLSRPFGTPSERKQAFKQPYNQNQAQNHEDRKVQIMRRKPEENDSRQHHQQHYQSHHQYHNQNQHHQYQPQHHQQNQQQYQSQQHGHPGYHHHDRRIPPQHHQYAKKTEAPPVHFNLPAHHAPAAVPQAAVVPQDQPTLNWQQQELLKQTSRRGRARGGGLRSSTGSIHAQDTEHPHADAVPLRHSQDDDARVKHHEAEPHHQRGGGGGGGGSGRRHHKPKTEKTILQKPVQPQQPQQSQQLQQPQSQPQDQPQTSPEKPSQPAEESVAAPAMTDSSSSTSSTSSSSSAGTSTAVASESHRGGKGGHGHRKGYRKGRGGGGGGGAAAAGAVSAGEQQPQQPQGGHQPHQHHRQHHHRHQHGQGGGHGGDQQQNGAAPADGLTWQQRQLLGGGGGGHRHSRPHREKE
eukprot:TRINITY_DN1874_c0_g1_i1.p1 TRINITY_DN1874_c0_g1~~TRINITY_DN1874_c0_g1_i1.p1  ORF type:complete len:1506 (-),score=344.16 TRINITY_DN1874_c0_g1_i1:134-4651(-)